MKMHSGGAWAVATAFIVLGLLTWAYPSWFSNGVAWIIAGFVALLVSWAMVPKK